MKKKITLFLLFIVQISYSQTYVPDSSFNLNGTKLYTFYNNIDRSFGSVVQDDQKIVIVGLSKNQGTGFFELCFARFNSDGTVDNTFGTNGTTKVGMGNQGSIGGMTPRIKMDENGRFVAINSGRPPANGSQDFMVCRLDTSGMPDLTFNSTGVKFIDILGSNTQPDQANAFDFDAAGNIYITGVVGVAPPIDNEFAVVKLTPSGQLDVSFDSDGKKIYNPTSSNEFGTGLAVQPDGKIVFGGTAANKMYVIRIDSTGNYDTSFNTTGQLNLNFAGSSEMLALSIDSLNRIIIGGLANSTSGAVVRILPNGTLDNTFGSSGAKIFNIQSLNTTVGGIEIVDGVKVIVAGSAGNTSSADFYVARFDSTGTLDTTFNSTGYIKKAIAPGSVEDNADAVSVLADGRIFVCGTAVFSSAVNEDIAMLMIKPVSTVTDIATIESINKFDVYPNPVKSTLYISVNKAARVTLLDINGKQIKNMYLNAGLNVIDVKDLIPGNYLLMGENGKSTYQLVKN
jgi:uncharacterized delta-60 repeat protein